MSGCTKFEVGIASGCFMQTIYASESSTVTANHCLLNCCTTLSLWCIQMEIWY